MTEIPVACTLSDRELAERRGGLLSELRGHRQETRWLSDGVALRFPSGPSVIACVAEFIRLESQCCPFLRFQLDFPEVSTTRFLRGVSGQAATACASPRIVMALSWRSLPPPSASLGAWHAVFLVPLSFADDRSGGPGRVPP